MTKPRPQFESIFSTKTPLTKEKHKSLEKILDTLYMQPESYEFREPLEYKERGLINYDSIIQNPMDISTVQKRLKLNNFRSCEECLDLAQTIFQNSFLYNHSTEWIILLTKKCEQVFHKLIRNYLPEVGFRSDLGNKKLQKGIKRLQKLEISQKIESSPKEKNISHSVSLSQKEEQSEFTSISMSSPKKNSKSQHTLKPSVIPEQGRFLFHLVRQASKKALEVLYIMAKNEDMSAISSDKNGNCQIDIEMLPKTFILKAIAFLKSQKERESNVESKEKKKKNKVKHEPVLSRYEV